MGGKYVNIIEPPVSQDYKGGWGQIITEKLGPLSEIKEAFWYIIEPLLPSYFNGTRGSNGFDFFYPSISKIWEGNLI